MFKPQDRGRAFADHLLFCIRQFAEEIFQGRTGLETGHSQQDMFVVRGDSDFGEDRVLLQLFELGLLQAAALNKGKAVLTAEEAQVAPHFTFWVAMRGQQVLVFGHLADVGGHLALQIFFGVGTAERCQRPVIKRNKRQRQTRRGGGLARRKWCKCHNDILNCLTL